MAVRSPASADSDPHEGRASNLQALPQRTYRLRMLGMGLAGLPLAAVLLEIEGHWLAWAWLVFSCLLWPHVAYLIARRSKDPFRAELRNFVIDSAMAGSWAPMMQFNVLPTAVLLTVVSADKINAGVRGLWQRSLPGMIAGLALMGLLTGFEIRLDTSMPVLLACLPILVIHTIAVSLSSYKLVRRVQRQNIQLEEVSRCDSLTGLDSRRHWQKQAEILLARHLGNGAVATLLLLDIDRFKDVNDRYGHGAGDDVLLSVADTIRGGLTPGSQAGRLGGDEFVIALPVDMERAVAIAEGLRVAVESLDFPRYPGLRCSISIGLALPPDADLGLREWIEAADRALYVAKRGGRNRTAGSDSMLESRL